MIIYFLYWSLLQLWENLITFKRLSAKKEDKDCEERKKKRKEKEIKGIEHSTCLQSKDRDVNEVFLLVRGKCFCQATIWTIKYKS